MKKRIICSTRGSNELKIKRNQLESSRVSRLAVYESILSNDFSLISLNYCVEQDMMLVMKTCSDGSRTTFGRRFIKYYS
jgi:hypothetical protein